MSVYNGEFFKTVFVISGMIEQEKLDRYVQGLKVGSRKEVWVRQCKILREVMVVVDRVDVIYYEFRGWGRTGGGIINTICNTGTGVMGGTASMELGQVRQYFQGNCYICGELGYRNSECLQRVRGFGCSGGRVVRGNNQNRSRVNVMEVEDDQSENEEFQLFRGLMLRVLCFYCRIIREVSLCVFEVKEGVGYKICLQ